MRRGARWGIRILCPRQDDFEGDIVISAEGLPEGVQANSLTLSGKSDRGILVVSAAEDANSWAGNIRIVGRCDRGGKEIVREAKFASLVWGHIFADSIRVRSRLTKQIPLSVSAAESAPVIIDVDTQKVWTVEIGETLELPIKVIDNGARKGTLTVEPRGLFGMLRSPPTVNINEDQTSGTLKINFTRNGNFAVETGEYQFVLHATGVATYRESLAALNQAIAEAERLREIGSTLTTEIETAKAANDDPQSIKELAGKLVRLKNEEKKLARSLASLQNTAKEKNVNFAAWSELITIRVEPAKKK